MASHLTFPERVFLDRLRKKGRPIAEIAELMARDRSTLYRELHRNSRKGVYEPEQAQRLAKKRRQACRRPHKLGAPDTREYVRERLENRWSPEQIAGQRQREFTRQRCQWLSRQTIYNWINTQDPRWKRWLRRGGRPPEKRGKLTDCIRIAGRPEVINQRRRYGDWEGDTMVGKGRRSALLTLVERKSGYTQIGRADNLKAVTARQVAVERMKDLPASLR